MSFHRVDVSMRQSKSNTKEAKELWKKFYKKYPHDGEGRIDNSKKDCHHCTKKLSGFKKSNFMDSITIKGMTPKEIETKIHKKEIKAHKHSADEDKIKTQMIANKLEILTKAIKIGDWYNRIFQDKSVAELSRALYSSDKISYQQLCSVLERLQIKTLKDMLIYSILDKNGEFSHEAVDILLPAIRMTFYLQKPTKNQLDEFKLLISTLPQSEKFFYCSCPGSQHKRASIRDPSLLHLDNCDINLTMGARDALGLARFGLEHYFPE